ncbi:MAG: VOC family protein [Candidatus Roizmanbacteria bacterium]
MKASKYRLALFSENPDALEQFYTGILGFKRTAKVETGEDYGYSVEIASGYKIWIAKHSRILGKNKDPYRIMISIYVDAIEEYFENIRKRTEIIILEEPTLTCIGIPGEERYVGAFLDPDGNCVQMMQLTGK